MATKLHEFNDAIIDRSKITDSPGEEWIIPNLLVGLEIEVERVPDGFVRYIEDMHDYWSYDLDGSLKENGIELRLSLPLLGKDLTAAIELLDDLPLDNHNFTRRTSLHVHLDSSRLVDTEALRRLLIVYTAFEKVLFKYAGKERYNNIFCTPLAEVWGVGMQFNSLNSNWRRSPLMMEDHSKYSALNLAPITTLGSVEFRQHRGTCNRSEIAGWVNILMCLYKYALDHHYSAASLGRSLSAHTGRGLLDEVFGEYAEVLDYRGMESDLYYGMRSALQFDERGQLNLSDLYPISPVDNLYDQRFGIGPQPEQDHGDSVDDVDLD